MPEAVQDVVDRRVTSAVPTFVFTAMSMVLLLWAGATGVDVGFTVYGSRQAQAMADTAALDLARYMNYADALFSSIPAVQSYLNGKLANVLTEQRVQRTAHSGARVVHQRDRKVHGRRLHGQFVQAVIAPPLSDLAATPSR